MFQVRDLSVKVFAQEEAPLPLFACVTCNTTPGIPGCGITALEEPLLVSGCKVCDSTPGIPGCGITGLEELKAQRDGLSLLRQQLRGELAGLN